MTGDVMEPSDFYDEETDAAEAARTIKRNQAPAGTYRTDPEELGEFQDTPTTYEDGRRSVRFFGKARRVVRTGDAVVMALRYSISPDRRAKRDTEGNEVEGKDDSATRLYAEAVASYGQARGEAPKNLRQLVDWLKTGQYDLVTFAGRDGLVINGIRAVRK